MKGLHPFADSDIPELTSRGSSNQTGWPNRSNQTIRYNVSETRLSNVRASSLFPRPPIRLSNYRRVASDFLERVVSLNVMIIFRVDFPQISGWFFLSSSDTLPDSRLDELIQSNRDKAFEPKHLSQSIWETSEPDQMPECRREHAIDDTERCWNFPACNLEVIGRYRADIGRYWKFQNEAFRTLRSATRKFSEL